jgi:hypothetical protein
VEVAVAVTEAAYTHSNKAGLVYNTLRRK